MIHAMRKSVASVAEIKPTNGESDVGFSRRQEREAAVGRFGGVRFFAVPSIGGARSAAPKPQVSAKAPARPARPAAWHLFFFFIYSKIYRCWASVHVIPEHLPRHPRSFALNFLLNPEQLPCRSRTRRELPRHPRTRRLEFPRQPRSKNCDLPPQPRTTPICQAWRLGEHRRSRVMERISTSTPNR